MVKAAVGSSFGHICLTFHEILEVAREIGYLGKISKIL